MVISKKNNNFKLNSFALLHETESSEHKAFPQLQSLFKKKKIK